METKSKKSLIVGLVIAIFIIIVLGGYIVYDKVLRNEEIIDTDKSSEQTMAAKIDVNKDWVYVKESSTINPIASDDEYPGIETYLPQININNQKVIDINKDIEKRYLNFLNEVTDTSFTTFTYEYYINSNILSFVLTEAYYCDYPSGCGSAEYEVLSFDINTGQELTNEELLVTKNISLNELKTKVNAKIENEIEKMKACNEESSEEKEAELRNSIDLDNLLIFLNNQNKLLVVISSFDCAETYSAIPHIVELDF